MPALPPYIPAKNADFVAWLANFSTLITASPATYALLAGDATVIAGQNTAIAAAYALITSPATKTKATVAAYNTAKVNALAIVRPYAQTISLNAGVSPTNKTAVGVNPRTSTPTPITAPTTTPVITIDSAFTGGLITRYRDSMASPSVKSKPYGVVQAQFFAEASTTAVTDPTLLPYQSVQTKSPFTLSLPGTAGKTIYVASRWITRSGLLGPWSPIVAYTSAQT